MGHELVSHRLAVAESEQIWPLAHGQSQPSVASFGKVHFQVSELLTHSQNIISRLLTLTFGCTQTLTDTELALDLVPLASHPEVDGHVRGVP